MLKKENVFFSNFDHVFLDEVPFDVDYRGMHDILVIVNVHVYITII